VGRENRCLCTKAGDQDGSKDGCEEITAPSQTKRRGVVNRNQAMYDPSRDACTVRRNKEAHRHGCQEYCLVRWSPRGKDARVNETIQNKGDM